jgi:hypothetical protein
LAGAETIIARNFHLHSQVEEKAEKMMLKPGANIESKARGRTSVQPLAPS